MITEDDLRKIFDETKMPPKKIQNELITGGSKIILNKDENFFPKEDGEYIYVKRGGINVFFLSEDGQNSVIAHKLNRNKGAYVSTGLSYIARTNSDIIYFSKDVLNRAFLNSSLFEYYLLKNQVEIFNEITTNVNRMYFGSVEKKLSMFLLREYEMNRRYKRNLNEEDNYVIKTTQETIAQNIGSAREVVSRKLSEFKDEGIIDTSRGKIIIIDKDRLKNYTI